MSKQSQVVRDHVRTFRKSGRDSLSEYLQQELGWNADNAASAIAEAGFDDSGMVLGDTLRACEQVGESLLAYAPMSGEVVAGLADAIDRRLVK